MEKLKWTKINEILGSRVGTEYGIDGIKKKYAQLHKNSAVATAALTAPATPAAAGASSSATTPKTTPSKTPKKTVTPKKPRAKPTLAKAKRSSIPKRPVTPSVSEENNDDEDVKNEGTLSTKIEDRDNNEEGVEDADMGGIKQDEDENEADAETNYSDEGDREDGGI